MRITTLSSGEKIRVVGVKPVIKNHVWPWEDRWFISDRNFAYGPYAGKWDTKEDAEMMLLKLMFEE